LTALIYHMNDKLNCQKILQVSCIRSICKRVDVLTVVPFCLNLTEHAFVHLLYDLCNLNLQCLNADWHRMHADGMLHKASYIQL
jgi:hypothetical protein